MAYQRIFGLYVYDSDSCVELPNIATHAYQDLHVWSCVRPAIGMWTSGGVSWTCWIHAEGVWSTVHVLPGGVGG